MFSLASTTQMTLSRNESFTTYGGTDTTAATSRRVTVVGTGRVRQLGSTARLCTHIFRIFLFFFKIWVFPRGCHGSAVKTVHRQAQPTKGMSAADSSNIVSAVNTVFAEGLGMITEPFTPLSKAEMTIMGAVRVGPPAQRELRSIHVYILPFPCRRLPTSPR